jgi:hypothetical protein
MADVMEYDVRDVVKVVAARGGFYGVVVGKTASASGALESDIAPLDGQSAWRVSESCVRPTDRGFPVDIIERAVANYVRPETLPFKFTLREEVLKHLCVHGSMDVEGCRIAFTVEGLGAIKPPIFHDQAMRMYWIRLED